MRQIALFIVFVALIFGETADNAIAETKPLNFQYVYDQCTGRTPFCIGYVEGVGEMMLLLGGDPHVRDVYGMCYGPRLQTPVPPRPTLNEMIDEIVEFGHSHPEMWSSEPLAITQIAFSFAWPCK